VLQPPYPSFHWQPCTNTARCYPMQSFWLEWTHTRAHRARTPPTGEMKVKAKVERQRWGW
jgi:hypothetical protein